MDLRVARGRRGPRALPDAARGCGSLAVRWRGRRSESSCSLLTWGLRRGTYSPVLRGSRAGSSSPRGWSAFSGSAADLDGRIRDFYRLPPRTVRGRDGAGASSAGAAGCSKPYLVLRLLLPGSGMGGGLRDRGAGDGAQQHAALHPGPRRERRGIRVGVFLVLGLSAGPGAAYSLVRRGRELAWVLPGLARLPPMAARALSPAEAGEQPWTPPIDNRQSSIFNSPVSVLLFDFGGTLDADGVPGRSGSSGCGAKKERIASRETFDRAFYAADDALGRRSAGVALPLAETAGAASPAASARSCGTRDGSLPERVAERFTAEARAQPRQERRALRAPRPATGSASSSNFYGNLEAVCREAAIGRYLSAAVDSAEVGRSKPDPAIFHAALEGSRPAPRKRSSSATRAARTWPARAGVGMRHVLVAGEAFNGFRPCCPGDSVIRRVEELAEMFL